MRSRQLGWFGIVLAVIGIVLAAVALIAAPQNGGMIGSNGAGYGVSNVAVGTLGGLLTGIGVVLALSGRLDEDLAVAPLSPTPIAHVHAEEEMREPGAAFPVVQSKPEGCREDIVLQLLTGDERVLYKTLLDSGGEALQKDIISRTHMSNAKVTRVLDRLEGRELITRERRGATNRVRLRRDV
jgi:uncharacterized membrane protein